MALLGQLRKSWARYVGNDKAILDWLEKLSPVPGDVTVIEGDITTINTSITNINTTITNIEGQLDGGGLLAPPSPTEPMASTDYPGVVELATQAEVNAGTDTARAITPATLLGTLPVIGHWSPLTNGITASPELVFNLGDVVMVWTEL